MYQVAALKKLESETRKGMYRPEDYKAQMEAFQNLYTLRNNVHRVIHEISSPFQSVVCFLHIARYKLDKGDSELKCDVDNMISETKRINDLLRRIVNLVDEAAKIRPIPTQVSFRKDEQLALDLH